MIFQATGRKNKMKNIITVINEDKEKVVIELIASFEIEEYNRQYIVFTLNDDGVSEELTIFISQIEYLEGLPKIISIPENEIELVLSFYDNLRDTMSCNR